MGGPSSCIVCQTDRTADLCSGSDPAYSYVYIIMVMVDMGYVPDMSSRISRIYALRLLQPFNSFQHVITHFLSLSFKRMNRQAAYTRCIVAVTTISQTVELLSELEALMCSKLVGA